MCDRHDVDAMPCVRLGFEPVRSVIGRRGLVEPFLIAFHGGRRSVYVQLLVRSAHQSFSFGVLRRIRAFGVGNEALNNLQRRGEVSLIEKRLYVESADRMRSGTGLNESVRQTLHLFEKAPSP